MKSHNGMRPQDIAILMRILTTPQLNWQYRDLAASLNLSVSEISDSLVRSHMAGLIDEGKRMVRRESLMEFIQYGMRYVFPAVAGTMVVGVPTAHSQSFFRARFEADLAYVWPDEDGDVRGLAIEPLYKKLPKAARQDDELHKMLAAIDILRVGRTREKKVALEELRKTIIG